ncbi:MULTISPECIES: hypothetical protein [unclassified Aeromicrobium]|uniref:hypothetical protein n=1 Tax=unclassified Aeromicrobium TaxID=2633570 RepID=UPI00288A4D0B|nr:MULTISPECIES: hypothetical protein [unclassified Aeromicrobium]
MTSNINDDSPDRQIVAHMNSRDVTKEMVAAIKDAIRDGVPVRELPDATMFHQRGTYLSTDAREQQAHETRTAIADAKADAAAAADLAIAAKKRRDEDGAARFLKKVSKADARARQLKAVLDDLETSTAPAERHPEAFDVDAEVWVPALNRIRSGGKFTQTERNALDVIMPNLSFHYRDGRWHGEATLRITTSRGVAELGPIRWTCANGVRTPTSAVERPAPGRSRDQRGLREIRVKLLSTGRVNDAAALILVQAPFTELRSVALHAFAGEDFPDWVGPKWREPEFIDWIAKTYAAKDFVGMHGQYGKSSPTRQFAATFVAKNGTSSPVDILAAMGAPGRDHTEFGRVRWDDSNRPFQPPLILENPGRPIAEQRYRSVLCECGAPASRVIRVPEIPRSLLCHCGLMPDSESFGASKTLRFPDEYGSLEISTEYCLAELERRHDPFKQLGPVADLCLRSSSKPRTATPKRNFSEPWSAKASTAPFEPWRDVGSLAQRALATSASGTPPHWEEKRPPSIRRASPFTRHENGLRQPVPLEYASARSGL